MHEPEQLGEYRILELIATGGMARIYRARHPSSFDKDIALKVVRAEVAADPELRSMFLSEARVALALSHANVVQTFEVVRHEEGVLLAMEHVDGLDVARLIHAYPAVHGERLSVRHAIHIVADALLGLDYAHRSRGPDGEALGLVHRDVSPGNILVSREGEVKVADFGVALSNVRAHESMDGVLKGKLAYMSPEQVRGEPIDLRTDVYAMGVVLYEMLTGRRPFAGSGVAIIPDVVAGQFPRPSELEPGLAPELEAIVLRAMATERDSRYDSAASMSYELGEAALHLGLVPSQIELGAIVEELCQPARESIPPSGPGAGPTLAARPQSKRPKG